MLELYIIRHGLAGKPLEDKVKDHKRPLKKKGKEMIKGVAKGLKNQKIQFDVILSSPLIRSKESAEIVNEYCGHNKKIVVTELLEPGASYNDLIKYLNKLKSSKKIAIVGHEPFLSGFTSYCLTKKKNPFINLKKGGVLVLEAEKVITPGQCMLSWLLEPDHVIIDE